MCTQAILGDLKIHQPSGRREEARRVEARKGRVLFASNFYGGGLEKHTHERTARALSLDGREGWAGWVALVGRLVYTQASSVLTLFPLPPSTHLPMASLTVSPFTETLSQPSSVQQPPQCVMQECKKSPFPTLFWGEKRRRGALCTSANTGWWWQPDLFETERLTLL